MSYRDEVLGIHVNDDVCAYTMRSHAAEIAARADARIAELEQSVTVRDTEIARLETDLELARIGARRYEVARRMNVRQLIDARTMHMHGKPFDEIMDELRPFMFPQEARAGNGESCDAV